MCCFVKGSKLSIHPNKNNKTFERNNNQYNTCTNNLFTKNKA